MDGVRELAADGGAGDEAAGRREPEDGAGAAPGAGARARPRLVIFGAGGHGKVVADAARSAGFEVVGFIDDDPRLEGATRLGLPVLSLERFEAAGQVPEPAFALGVGDNAARERSHARLCAAGHRVLTIVHRSAAVAPSARLGEGTVVVANASVNPDAQVGAGCIVNTGAVVEHDCVVGPYAHLSPNAALGGAVSIGARTHLGLGAVVLPGLKVGPDVRVGAAGAVIRDVAAGLTVVGVPARALPRRGAALRPLAAQGSGSAPEQAGAARQRA